MYRLSIIFTTSHADTLGNACRIEMVRFLTQHFETTIFTNRKDFCEHHFSNSIVVNIKTDIKHKIPFISDLIIWRSISKVITKIDCDAVFMFDDTSPISLWLNKPTFQYVHQFGERLNENTNFAKKTYRYLYNKFNDYFYTKGLINSSSVFVVSKPIIEILKSKGVINTFYTPHGIELDKFQKPLITKFHKRLQELKSNNYFIITYTGWVTENRGFQLMMDSIKDIVKNEYKVVLVIAGADHYYSEKIKTFSKNNNLGDNILNFGVIDFSLIPGILHFSDICYSFLDDMPAYKISPPQKVIEYFAAGKPVVCNKIQTHEWLVKDNVTGLITEYNYKDVSAKVLKLLKNKDLIRIFSRNVQEEVKKYDINVIYGDMFKIIKKTIDGH